MSEEQKILKRQKRAINLLVSQRNYRRARDRALTKLANRYRKQYLIFLEEEKANDKAQGKKRAIEMLDLVGIVVILLIFFDLESL